MAAILDWTAPGEGDPLPPLWHWLFCTAPVSQYALGSDGHENATLLNVRLAGLHRMWAAGDVTFLAPIKIGSLLTRTTTLTSFEVKSGRSGPLAFVTLCHAMQSDGRDAIRETQTLVYRPSRAASTKPETSPLACDDQQKEHAGQHCLDDLQLFRYSALTFNSHRIHLDRRYCAEHYGDNRLVAHGPLLATMIAREVAEAGLIGQFSFRALNPLHEGEPFFIVQDELKNRAKIMTAAGATCMEAVYQLEVD